MRKVLILCTGNSARSQMAEGLLRHEGEGHYEIHSAGVNPTHVRKEAIIVMNEIGIDISKHRSKSVDEFTGKKFDYILTVCDNARETCPYYPSDAILIHKSFEDPPPPGVGDDEYRLSIFRRVRDDLHEWMKLFVKAV